MTALHNLKTGQRARIDSLDGVHDEVARLSEMGLCTGAELTVIRNGSPCIIDINGGKLCVRSSTDTVIQVETLSRPR